MYIYIYIRIQFKLTRRSCCAAKFAIRFSASAFHAIRVRLCRIECKRKIELNRPIVPPNGIESSN